MAAFNKILSELIHSKYFLKISNLETSLLLLKIQTFIIVYNVFT